MAKWHGVSLYDATQEKFIFVKPWIYNGTEWKDVDIKIYEDNQWKLVGGACTQLIPFLTNTSQDFNTIENGNTYEPFLVREDIGWQKLLDSSGKYILDSNQGQLYADYRGI